MPRCGAEPAAVVEFEDAWISALPPFQTNTAAYLTVSNTGSCAVAIVGASSEAGGRAEIHTTRQVDGYMRMEQLPTASRWPPGRRLDLAPGGTHLMLLDLEYLPAAGDNVRAVSDTSCRGDQSALTRRCARAHGADHTSHQHH